jgi:hypothetical protein
MMCRKNTQILVGNILKRISFWTPRYRWKDNIKIEYGVRVAEELAQEGDLINTSSDFLKIR